MTTLCYQQVNVAPDRVLTCQVLVDGDSERRRFCCINGRRVKERDWMAEYRAWKNRGEQT